MKKLLLSFLLSFLCISCLLSTGNAFAKDSTINSIGITNATLSGISDCMKYHVVGICFWLRCSSVECHLEKTLKLDHYLPDTVISVFTKPTNNPWFFANKTLDPLAYKAGQAELQHFEGFNLGYGDENDESKRDLNNRFHEVDIIGNPALAVLSGDNYLLASAATPYMPYYSSLLDAQAWRFPGLERFYPGSMIPGLHDVGMLIIHDWGSVYPRNGFVNQPDDAKAAAVNALRASTIITQIAQPHLYSPLSNSCGTACSAAPVKENSKLSQYQMIYPKIETKCTVFGKSDITSQHPWETDASEKGDDRYVWVLWRHYHGCIQDNGAEYLGSIGS